MKFEFTCYEDKENSEYFYRETNCYEYTLKTYTYNGFPYENVRYTGMQGNWIKLSSPLVSVKSCESTERQFIGYELKPEVVKTDVLALTLEKDAFNYDDDENCNEGLRGLYLKKHQEVVIPPEEQEFIIVKTIKIGDKAYKAKYSNFIDLVYPTTYTPANSYCRCKVHYAQIYHLLYAKVKEVCESSDGIFEFGRYDFYIEVNLVIDLHTPEPYQYHPKLNSKRTVTAYNRHNKVKLIFINQEDYARGFKEFECIQDADNFIDEQIKNIIDVLGGHTRGKLMYCKCCDGLGVTLKDGTKIKETIR